MEIDIYIPSLNVGVEYDSESYHKNTQRDIKKDNLCNTLNINLIRIREPKCPIYDSSCKFYYLIDYTQKTFEDTINELLNYLGVKNVYININEDRIKIDELIVTKHLKNSLLKTRPDIAARWHPIKNGNLTPDNVAPNSNRKVWFICPICGHEWYSRIADVVRSLHKCPKCGKESSAIGDAKRVRCIELNQEFDSINQAQKQTGAKNISVHILGIRPSSGKHPITGEKLHWEVID